MMQVRVWSASGSSYVTWWDLRDYLDLPGLVMISNTGVTSIEILSVRPDLKVH